MNISKNLLIIFAFLFSIFSYNALFSQLTVSIREVENNTTTIDPWQFPLMKAKIRANFNGEIIKLDKSKILIKEENKISKPVFVGDFETDSAGRIWQLVKWYTRREGPTPPINFITTQRDSIYVFHQNQVAKTSGFYRRKDLSVVFFFDWKNNIIQDMQFESKSSSDKDVEIITIKAKKGQIDGSGSEGQIWIDSVKVSTDNFRIKWDGNIIDRRPPPLHIWGDLPYDIRVYYQPKEKSYHIDTLAVYYDKGLSNKIIITGNEYHISEEANNLKLTYPNGDEYFTPCQKINIKWDGYIRGMITYIDYSSNGGSSWKKIGESLDSSFIWRVQSDATQSGMLRVRQSFNSSNPSLLKIDDIPVAKIKFNYDGSRLLSANNAGVINEWNTVNNELVQQYSIDDIDYPASRTKIFGIDYTIKDSVFVVAYQWTTIYPRKDSIAFFRVGESMPFLRKASAENFQTARVHFDNQKRFMAFIPDFGLQIKIFSAEDGGFIRNLDFDYPVSAFKFSADLDLASVALMSGEIQILTLPDFEVRSKLDYSFFPLILELGFSPNGKFLAIGCKASKPTTFVDNRNDVIIVDIESNLLVRRLRRGASDPLGLEFSPQSTKLLVGSYSDPQIIYWDLPVDEIFRSFKGHSGKLTDFAFAPEGSIIASSSSSSDNLYIRRFSYAESDESDSYFNVITPDLNIKPIIVPDAYIAENYDYDFNNSLCVIDTSEVFLKIDSIKLANAYHFTLLEPLPFDTTLYPGECMPLSLNYFPRDTGSISDSIIIFSCTQRYSIPISSVGLPRHIELLSEILEFEQTCIGSKVEKNFPLAVNNDPVPVLINTIQIVEENEQNPFIGLNQWNQVYQPGDTIFSKIRFEPVLLGEVERKINILHSNQYKFVVKTSVKGTGIGTNYELSHYDLRFIPEIKNRKVKVINISDNDIYIEKVEVSPPGNFIVTTSLPKDIPANSEDYIDIVWNGEYSGYVELIITAGPCAAEKRITLGKYNANSKIVIPDVFADPKGRTTIKINYENNENAAYNGIRPFEGEIIINPRLFLPESVSSPFGEAELIRNEIINDRRIIGFHVDGDFPQFGTVAEIHGIVGLAEIDSSHINLLPSNDYWGVSSIVNLGSGIFNLINIYGQRLVVHNNLISNIKINPNPSEGSVQLEFDSEKAGKGSIEVFNNLGLKVLASSKFTISDGYNNQEFDFSQLKSGTYNLIIRQENSSSILRLIIIK